jgi:hypothetical protein
MAGTVTTNLITLDDADALGTWAGAGSFFSGLNSVLDVDNKVQGTGCMSWGLKNAGTDVLRVTFTSISMTNYHIYVWFRCDLLSSIDTYANGGFRIRLYNGATANYAEWYVGGSDIQNGQYTGGWVCLVQDLMATPDVLSGVTHPSFLSSVGSFAMAVVVATGATKGVANTFIDAVRVGKGSLIINGGTSSDPANFETMYQTSSLIANQWGLLDKKAGVYIGRGNLQIGSGSASTYFQDQSQIIAFESLPVSSSTKSPANPDNGHYYITITGSLTTCSFGTPIGSGDSTLGVESVIIKGNSYTNTLASTTIPLRPSIKIDNNVKSLSFYGCIFDSIGSVNFGFEKNRWTVPNLNLVDNTFSNTYPILKNLAIPPVLSLRNKILSTTASYSDGNQYAFQLVDTGSIDGGGFSVLNTYGFKSTGSNATETYTITNHDFTSDSRYLTVYANKTWNIVNPSWTLPIDVDKVKFTVSSSNYVNEGYSYDVLVKDSDGNNLSASKAYIYEETTTDSIYLRYQSNASGIISSQIPVAVYTINSGLTAVVSQSYGGFANKYYKYGYTPFAAGITVNVAINQNVTLVPDSGITAADAATALSNGAGVGVTHATTQAVKVINYDGGTISFTSSSLVTGQSSGATGNVVEVIGDSTSGTLVLANGNATAFIDNENLQVSAATYALANLFSATSGFSGSYSWLVDANTYSLATTYDYLAAKMDEFPISSLFEEVLVWGKSTQTQLLYAGGSGYFTNRNVANVAGVWVANRGTGTVAFMTSDEGYQYIPPVQYSLGLTGIIAGSEVRVYLTGSATGSMGEELAGIESAGTTFSYNYIYAADQYIDIVVVNTGYEYLRIQNVLVTNANSSIPVQQRIDRNYNNPV